MTITFRPPRQKAPEPSPEEKLYAEVVALVGEDKAPAVLRLLERECEGAREDVMRFFERRL